jgi:hypothetical protein
MNAWNFKYPRGIYSSELYNNFSKQSQTVVVGANPSLLKTVLNKEKAEKRG